MHEETVTAVLAHDVHAEQLRPERAALKSPKYPAGHCSKQDPAYKKAPFVQPVQEPVLLQVAQSAGQLTHCAAEGYVPGGHDGTHWC